MAAKVTKFNPQDILDGQVAQIDEQLALIERKLKPYQKYIDAKTQLLAARRALLGHGPRTTGGTSTRLHMEDIVQHLKDNPGQSAGEVAQHFGVSQTTVSSHIYRNKGRFINKDGRYWARDPKAGLNSTVDIEDEDEE